MTGRVVLASRQFQRQYPAFRQKYTDLERHFRDFLGFRQNHRPDEQFNANDGRVSGTKCNLCHLIHGKALVMYQLFGTEIRLIAMGDMDESVKARSYARSLGREDFYMFEEAEQPEPGKPQMDNDLPVLPPADTVEMTLEQPDQQPEQPDHSEHLWSDRAIQVARDQQLLYEPRSDQSVVAFKVDKDLIIPKGDMMVFVPAVSTFFHLTCDQFDAVYRSSARKTTDVGEAVAVSIASLAPATAPVVQRTVVTPGPMPDDAPQPDVVPIRRRRMRPVEEIDEIVDDLTTDTTAKSGKLVIKPGQHDVGSQIGRLIHVIGHLEHMVGNNLIDFATIKRYMDERDFASLSSILFAAQNQGFVMRSGTKEDGRSFYYCLTDGGKQKMEMLGDAPFTTARMQPPFSKPGRVRRVAGAH